MRHVLGFIAAVTLVTAVTASAATLSIDAGTLSVFTAEAEIEVPPPTGTGAVGCDLDFHRDPVALLRWEPSPPPVGGYRIAHRGPIFDVWHGLDEVDGETTEYALKPSFLQHRYAVASTADGEQSEWSASPWVHCKPWSTYFLDGILEGFEHHSVRTIVLEWAADERSEQYVVLRGTQSAGPYQALATTSAATFVDESLENGVTYYYRVIGVDGLGMESEPSNEIEIVDQLYGDTAAEGDEDGLEPTATPEATPPPGVTPTPEATATATHEPEG